MNKILIVVALLLVITIGGISVGAFVFVTPENIAATAVSNAFGDFFERKEFKPIGETLTNGSINFTLDGIQKDGEELFEGNSVAGKLYFSKDAVMLDEAEIKILDTELSGSAYISEDMFYVEEENILDGAYGVNLKSFADDFADSIFAADSGSKYAIPEEDYEKIEAILESVDEAQERKTEMQKDVKKLSKTLVKDIWAIIVDNSEISSEKTDVRIQGTKTEVRQITIKIDDDAMENIVSDVYQYFCDSEDIVNFLDKYEDILNPVYQMIADDEDKYISEAYEEMLEDMEESVDDVCDMIGNGGFEDITVKIATPKIFPKLLKMDVSVGKTSVFVLDCGEDGIKNTDTIEVEMAGIKLVYNINEDTDDKFDSSIVLDSKYDDDVITLSLVIDKKRDKYTASAEVLNERYDEEGTYTYKTKYSIKGDFEEDGKTITMSVDEIVSESGDVSETLDKETITVDCEIIIKKKDKMPAPNKDFDTIADITEEDIENWIENLGLDAEKAPADEDPA